MPGARASHFILDHAAQWESGLSPDSLTRADLLPLPDSTGSTGPSHYGPTLYPPTGSWPTSRRPLPGKGDQKFRPDCKNTLCAGPPAPTFIAPDDTRTCLTDFNRNGCRLQLEPLAAFTVNTYGTSREWIWSEERTHLRHDFWQTLANTIPKRGQNGLRQAERLSS